MPDLPPRRAARTSGSRPIIGRLSPAIRALLIAEAAIYAVYLLVRPLRPVMEAHLAVGPRLFAGEYWQLVTAIFLHLDPQSLLYSVVGIWWAGADVERAQGTRRMIALFLVARGSDQPGVRGGARDTRSARGRSSAAPRSPSWRCSWRSAGSTTGRRRRSSAPSPSRRATSRWRFVGWSVVARAGGAGRQLGRAWRPSPLATVVGVPRRGARGLRGAVGRAQGAPAPPPVPGHRRGAGRPPKKYVN